MQQQHEEGELEKEIELNEIHIEDSYENFKQRKINYLDKLSDYKRQLAVFIQKRQITGEEMIKLFPISYTFSIIIGIPFMIFEEVNWCVFSLILISFLGILTHYLNKRLLIKLLLRLIFTSVLLLTLVRKLKGDYLTKVASSSKLEIMLLMKIFLYGHIFIILNDQFGLWEIDFIIAIMQISGVVYLSDGSYNTYTFWTLILFPIYLFFKKFQSGMWVQQYLSLYRESAHLQQIFHDLWPHSLFVTTLDNKNQINLQFSNRRANDVIAHEKSFASYFQKIKFFQFQKDISNISLGTYSKKDNLLKLLETKHRKFEEQVVSNQQIAIIPPQKSNQIIRNPQTSNQYLQSQPQAKQVITQSLRNSDKNKSIKLIPQTSSVSPSKHYHSSLSKHVISENGVNNLKEIDFDPNKRKSTNIWTDNGFIKNTLADVEDGFQQKIDKYEGMYFYSPDDEEKFKPITVKIYYYCKSEESIKSKSIFQKGSSMINTSLLNEQKQRFLFVEIKSQDSKLSKETTPNDIISSKQNQNSKASDKLGLLKITKKFVKDINQHFQSIVSPYRQLMELMVSQQYQYNSQLHMMQIQQLQQPLQVSNYDIQTKPMQQQYQQVEAIENNSQFPYHLEYIQSQINTLIDHLRIQLNKPTKLMVEEINMQILFQDFFKNVQDSAYRKMDYQLEMDTSSFPQKYKQDPGRVKQILHFLFKRLVTTHDCIKPKFIMKVCYVKKRTESLFNPNSLSFMDSRISQQQSNEPYRKSTHQYRKSTLKQVSNLYSNSNCFVVELILKGHCNFESVIKKEQLKDKDKLFRTIEKLSQYLGSHQIEFISEKDSLLRKYVFSLKEVTPKQTQNIDEKQEASNQTALVNENDNKQQEVQTQNIGLDSNQAADNIQNKQTKQNSPTSVNNLDKQIFFHPSHNNSQANLFKIENHPLSTPNNRLQNAILFSQMNAYQIDNNFQDQSQQSMQEIILEGITDSQVIVNQPIQFQSKFIK